MRARAARLLAALLVLLLSALLLFGVLADSGRSLLLAELSGQGGAGLDQEKIADFDEFPVTYEMRQPSTVQALGTSHAVTVIGTNNRYRDVLGYVMLDGGFLTASAWNEKQRYAVLNEAAAFELFGGVSVSGNTLSLNGEDWTVTGVMRDGDTAANLYAPGSVTGGRPQALMVLLDQDDTSGAVAKNELKDLGLQSSGADFISLARTEGAFWERFSVAWQVAVCLLILFLAGGQIRRLSGRLRDFRRRLRRMYLRDAVAQSPGAFAAMAGTLGLLVGGVAVILFFYLRILNVCLGWQQLASLVGRSAFSLVTDPLHVYQTWSVVCFVAFLILLPLFIHCLRRPDTEGDEQT